MDHMNRTPSSQNFPGGADLVVTQKWVQQQVVVDPSSLEGFRIVFLSDDYSLYLELVDRSKLEIETSGGLFHKILSEVKGDFLLLLRQIEKQNDPQIYWRTALASRNSAGVPLLRNLCYVLAAQRIAQTADESGSKKTESKKDGLKKSAHLKNTSKENASDKNKFCFIVQTRGTAATLASLLEETLSRNVAVKMTSRERFAPLFELPRLLAKTMYFIVHGLRQWTRARRMSLRRIPAVSTHDKPLTILRSWITKGTAQQSDRGGRTIYRDRNYGELPAYLQAQGQRVVILPMYFNLAKAEIETMRDLEQIEFEVLHPEIYLSIGDFFRAAWKSLREIRLRLNDLSFRNIRIVKLVVEAHRSTCCSFSLMRLNLAEELMRRMAAQGYRIEQLIYPIENNAPEKVLLRALRRYYSGTRISGFQHTVWYKEQLGMSLGPGESDTHPLPDRIFCSGKKYLEILSGENFPGRLLKLGANLRYTDVNRYTPADAVGEKSAQVVVPRLLVVLNFDWNHTFEMLAQLARALRDLPPVDIKIKPHPVLDESRLRQYLQRIEFPSFSFLGGRVQDAVSVSDAVVMTAGSVSNLEVLAMGVPLIRVSLANNFDFECVWEDDPDFLLGDSPVELSRRMREVLFESADVRERFRAKASRIVADYFEPVSDDKLSVFL